MRDEHGLRVVLPASLADGVQWENTHLGVAATVRHEHAQPTPAARDGVDHRYEDGLGPGFDVSWMFGPHGARDHVVLPHAPPDGRVRYQLSLDRGVAGMRVASGVVELLDEVGTPALRVSGAGVVGADGRARELSLDVSGCAVDRGAAPPWGRTPLAPGDGPCWIEAALPEDLAYPAVFDPLWTSAMPMVFPRYEFEAALMPDGRVLAVGGMYDNGVRFTSELFDPATDTWSPAPSADLSYAGASRGATEFTLTSLEDGRVLLTGGYWDVITGVKTKDIAMTLSPTTLTWTVEASLSQPRRVHTATKLGDGRVLVAGGRSSTSVELASSELFDPVTNSWSPTGPLTEARSHHRAVAVGGRALVTGGIPVGFSSTNTSEEFDPSADGGVGAWGRYAIFGGSRYGHAMSPLGTDRVLMVGGHNGSTTSGGFQTEIQVYDLVQGTWSAGGTFPFTATDGRATQTPEGGVLYTGGCGPGFTDECATPVGPALYFALDGTFSTAETVGTARGKHQALRLEDGRVLVMGGQNGFVGNSALSDTRLFAFSPAGEPCALDTNCLSEHCVDGVCCDTACDELCEACLFALTGAPDGTCAPIEVGQDPESECLDEGSPNCGDNGLCAGVSGQCQTYPGPGCVPSPCASGDECDSGHCVDGVCCDTPCNEACRACSAAKKGEGVDGTCGAITRGRDPDDECLDDAGGTCESEWRCDGLGSCQRALDLCAPISCSATGCLSSCSEDRECNDGFVCVAGGCVGEDQLCTNDSLALARDGSVSDCAPYKCTNEGCLTACTSKAECKSPYVCDPDAQACVLPPASTGGDAGCSVARQRSSGMVGALWLGLGLAVASRRRRRR